MVKVIKNCKHSQSKFNKININKPIKYDHCQ